jgi:hypothetical protein
MYIIKTERLGITHASVGEDRWPVGQPVELDQEQVKAVESIPGFTVEKDDLTVDELRERAKSAGIEGAASMKKKELLEALQNTTNTEGQGDPGYAGGSAPPVPPATT